MLVNMVTSYADEYREREYRELLVFKRKRQKVSQAEMAAALGLSSAWVSYLEKGHQPWRWVWYTRYCERLNEAPAPRELNPLKFRGDTRRTLTPRGPKLTRILQIPVRPEQGDRLQAIASAFQINIAELMRRLGDRAWEEFQAETSSDAAPESTGK